MAGVVQAADYYVSTTGNDANSGTLASPFATIQHAVDQATSGDTVYVRAGTYREEVDMSGDSNGTLTAYRKEAVTISGCDIVTGAWTTAAHDANIQQLTIPTEVMQLFVGGERMNLARYPDEDAGQNMFSQGEWTPTTTERQVAGEWTQWSKFFQCSMRENQFFRRQVCQCVRTKLLLGERTRGSKIKCWHRSRLHHQSPQCLINCD